MLVCTYVLNSVVIESVDSIRRDGTDMQYMIIQLKITEALNLGAFTTMYYSSSSIYDLQDS